MVTHRAGRAVVAALVVFVVAIGGAGPAAAEDDHTHERFVDEFGPVLIEVGANPCTGQESQASVTTGVAIGEIETENGRQHGEVTVRRTETLIENGFEAKVVESQEINIDNGEGRVEIELEVEAIHPETGDHFTVHVDVVLTISGGEVVDVQETELLSPCEMGG